MDIVVGFQIKPLGPRKCIESLVNRGVRRVLHGFTGVIRLRSSKFQRIIVVPCKWCLENRIECLIPYQQERTKLSFRGPLKPFTVQRLCRVVNSLSPIHCHLPIIKFDHSTLTATPFHHSNSSRPNLWSSKINVTIFWTRSMSHWREYTTILAPV